LINVFVGGELTEFIEFYLHKSLDNLAGSFSITTRKRLEIGKTLKIVINGQICLDGYIEVSTSSLTSSGVCFTASGRDKTGDLVDSCIDIKEVKNKPLKEVVEGITIKLGIACKSNEKFKISLNPNPGDTIFAALSKVLAPKEIHLFTRNGELHVGQIEIETKPEFIFEEGRNILSIEYTENHTERFQKYIGKKVKVYFEQEKTKDVIIEDADIKRPRHLILVSDEPKTECKQQKEIRKAKSRTVTLSVMGYHQDSKLFEVGKIAQVLSKSLGLSENFIINQLSFNVSRNEKKITKIDLISPNSIEKPKKEKAPSAWDKI
jgi:prophage tail gpP-like protein